MKFTYCILIGLLLANHACAEGQFVVIAHRDAAVERIDADQTAQIFLKQIQTWSDGRAIQPIDLKPDAPLRAEFYKKISGRSPGQLRAYWARQAFTGMGSPPRQAASVEEMTRIVQSTPGAIGYVGRKEADGQVKVVLDPNK